MAFGVHSEVGRLRQVIVHRPGLKLSRLTPRNIGGLLFDDVMWARRTKEEHDVFAEALRERGVTVHYFAQLLGETLEIPDGRAFVLDRVVTPEMVGPALVGPLRALPQDLDGATLAEYLIGGVLKADLHPGRPVSLRWDMLRADDFLLPPLPNHLFPREIRAGSTAACRSTRWPCPPGSGRPCMPGRSTATIRCSPEPTSSPTTEVTTSATCPPL